MPIASQAREVDVYLMFRDINSKALEVVLVLGNQSVNVLKQCLT